MAQDQSQLDRIAEPKPASSSNVQAGVKTILVHIQNDQSLDQTLETALSIARACGAHLSCLHVTPIQAYVAFDSFGGVFVMSDVFKNIEEADARLDQRLRKQQTDRPA